MGMMDKMMGLMMGRMSKEEKKEMMGGVMDKFFADMTAEDKGKMMMEMMPKMMMGMMGDSESVCKNGQTAEMPMMPQMMMDMMPHCLSMMLPHMPKEERVTFVLKMITILMERGCTGMSEEEKEEFLARAVEKVMV